MRIVLSPEFFDRPVIAVARDLPGKYLVRRTGGKEVALMITEVEAYGDARDLASHARHGLTARNAPMYAKAGTLYVYFTYGMHWMLNVACGKAGHPSGVLIRGVEGHGGPAKLTKFLKIDKKLNGTMLGKAAGLWIEDRGVRVKKIKTPRIGVTYAGRWAIKPWRFVITKLP